MSVKMRQNKYNHTNTMIKWAIVKRFFLVPLGSVCVSVTVTRYTALTMLFSYTKREPQTTVLNRLKKMAGMPPAYM